jgi:hypothetical protein
VTAEDVLESSDAGLPARLPRLSGPARPWLRWGALAAAAGVTMVLAGPPVPVRTLPGTATPPPVPPVSCRPVLPAALTAPRLAPPPGLGMFPVATACAGEQSLTYRGRTGDAVAELTLYRPGALDPAPVRRDRQVRIGARTGYYGLHPGGLRTDPAGVVGFDLATLAWEYAPGRWAVAQEVPRSPAAVARPDTFLPTGLAIAGTIGPDLPEVGLRVPVRLGWLPDGLALTAASGVPDGTARRTDGSGSLSLGSADAAAAGCREHRCLDRLDVQIGHRVHKFPLTSYLGKTVQVGDTQGLLTYYDDEDGRHQPTVEIFRGDWEIQISSATRGPPPATADLIRIAAAAALPDSTDPATWFPLTSAVPD